MIEDSSKEKRITLLVDEINELNEKFNAIKQQLEEKSNELDSLREFNKTWVWCRTHNHKHKTTSFLSQYKHSTQRIPKRCLFESDHVWILVDYVERNPFKDENGKEMVEEYQCYECMICKKERKEFYKNKPNYKDFPLKIDLDKLSES